MWSADSATGALTPTWINTNGIHTVTSLVLVPGSSAIVLVGDVGIFEATYSTGTQVSFTLTNISS
ncbi:hypothetical protein BT63DRAFT_274230 [Microthyrium microscopicum]|uniref:Uncharacterized protein n=1 Tax=Microthyrium microscopicum TaxID=703497 RepID=A0A6A6U8S0_9PEZI|nr:hypothetical protein BT63DRAFT_274230 [Microthyrium microscopicum]